MGCFEGIVKLNGCSITEIPGAVYNVNSLPGISIKSFEQVANSEQQNYLGVWNAINERAEARIKNQIITHLSTRYDIKRVRRTVDIFGTPETVASSDNKFKGIVITSSYTLADDWKISPMQSVSVDKIRLYKSVTTTVTNLNVYFFNYITKEVLYTYTANYNSFTTGWNEVSILKEFSCANLAIGLLDKDIDGVEYSSNDANGLYGYCYDECYNGDGCGQVRGFISSNNLISGQLSDNTTINSIQALVTLGCSYDSAVCMNRLLFGEAYWYLLGIEFMTERLFSERINFYTSVKREEAKELLDLYTIRYEEALKNALGGLKFECDPCLECNSQVQVFTQIP
jgi:hypothetical protein